jgi:hypothetical protein
VTRVREKKMAVVGWQKKGGWKRGNVSQTSGSGCVAVGPVDAGEQRGSNGTKYNVAVAVLTVL